MHGIRGETILIVKDVIVRGARGSKKTGMGLEVEIELGGRRDLAINDKTSWAIATAISLTLLREEADVMAFADDDHSELRDDGEVQRSTGSFNLRNFSFNNLLELSFTHAVTEHDDALGEGSLLLNTRLHLIVDMHPNTVLDHFFGIINDFLSRLLDFGDGDITREGRVDVGDHRSEGRFVLDTRGGMDDVGADDDGRVLSISEEGDGFGVRDGVDAAEFNIDFQADISIVLRLSAEALVASEALSSDTDLAI